MKVLHTPFIAMTFALLTASLSADELPGFSRQAQENPSFSAEQLSLIRQRADRLVSELAYLVEDLSMERQVPPQVHQQADTAMQEAIHFQRALRPGLSQEHMERDFRAMDKQVHQLLRSVQSVEGTSLRRGIARVSYADQQLHYTVSQGNQTEERTREVIARQAHALDSEAKQLKQAAQYVLQRRGGGQRLLEEISHFADDAAHFHEAVEKGVSSEHVSRDFASLDEHWHQLIRNLNRDRQVSFYLRHRAEQVNAIHNQLHQLMKQKTERPRVEFSFEVD